MIGRDNRPVVRLVPVAQREPRKQFGSMKGLVAIGPEFFEPLPPEELEAWEG